MRRRRNTKGWKRYLAGGSGGGPGFPLLAVLVIGHGGLRDTNEGVRQWGRHVPSEREREKGKEEEGGELTSNSREKL